MVCWPLPHVAETLNPCIKHDIMFTNNTTDLIKDFLYLAREQAGAQRMKVGEYLWKQCVDELQQAKPTREGIPSRAYYKLIEIMRECIIAVPNNALLLCEAPGGFGQALRDMSNNKRRHTESRVL